MPGVYDRFTISWQGEREVKEAAQIRKLVKEQQLTFAGLLKGLLRSWVSTQEKTK